MKLYGPLAKWWPLLSPRENQEAQGLLFGAVFANGLEGWSSFLELGCGSGALASFLPEHVEKVLVDSSKEMLVLCGENNPSASCIPGDMRTLRLNRSFDAVLIHDALMYLTTPADLLAAIQTAAAHCRPGGLVLLVPDLTQEDFQEGNTVLAGGQTEDLAVRLMEWHWDPDPADNSTLAELSFLIQENGQVTAHHETHHGPISTR
jgi:SAM-dependent methyltransferase